MATESRCGICKDPASKVAVAELRAQGVPVRQIASRLKIAKSSMDRHVKHANLARVDSSTTSRGNLAQAGRARAGRCSSCGLSVENPDPASLLKRAERLLHNAELVVERASADDDYRLQLQGLDRVRSSLELIMKAVGMLQPDSTTVNIALDQRRQANANLAQLTVEELRWMARSMAPETIEHVTDNRKLTAEMAALPPSEILPTS